MQKFELRIESINWQKVDNLLPVIVQDHATDCVLMLGYMNSDALAKTLEAGLVTFYSRTKERLWTKGETSGNYLNCVSISLDCDNDTLLIKASPVGPVCHLGNDTCFGNTNNQANNFLFQLENTIKQRKKNPQKGSYTSELFAKGIKASSQKVGEEAVETVIAALHETDKALVSESADLLYHLLVLLAERNIAFSDVLQSLEHRHQQ